MNPKQNKEICQATLNSEKTITKGYIIISGQAPSWIYLEKLIEDKQTELGYISREKKDLVKELEKELERLFIPEPIVLVDPSKYKSRYNKRNIQHPKQKKK